MSGLPEKPIPPVRTLFGPLAFAFLLVAPAFGNPIAVTHDDTECLLSTLRRGFPSSLAIGAREDNKDAAPRAAPFHGSDGRLIAPMSARVNSNNVARLEVNDDLGMDQPQLLSPAPAHGGGPAAALATGKRGRRAGSLVTNSLLGGVSSDSHLSRPDYHAALRRLPRRSSFGSHPEGSATEQRWILGPVPEPASWVAWVLGGAGVVLLHRGTRWRAGRRSRDRTTESGVKPARRA